MTAVNPRVQVTLSKTAYRTLAALAKRQSRSMSSIAAEMLTGLLPHMGAAYSMAQDVRTMGPDHLAAVRDMVGALDRVNQAAIAELKNVKKPFVMDTRLNNAWMGPQGPATLEKPASKRRKPKQLDLVASLTADVKTDRLKSQGSGEKAAMGGARRPPGTNRGV